MTIDQTNGPAVTSVDASSTEVGQYVWRIFDGSWWWSDAMYRLYGYEPHSVEPTLERFLQHKDPRDMARIDAVFDRASSKGGPFSCYHRIIDTARRHKTVVVVGHGERDPDDSHTMSIHGFMVDVTTDGREETNQALQAALQTRAGIEQVKGAIMLVHGLDADAAFDVLRGHSQVYNKKLSAIVSAALKAFDERDGAEKVSRGELDQLLWDAAH